MFLLDMIASPFVLLESPFILGIVGVIIAIIIILTIIRIKRG